MPKIGYITPSGFKQITTDKKGAFSETAKSYASLLVMGMFFGVEPKELKTASINWGNETEWSAIKAYEEQEFVVVEKPGFVVHPKLHFVGGTPDGLVNPRGGVDTKCPDQHNHLKNILTGEQMSLYASQFQGYMWIFGRDWWDMASYDPRYPEIARLSVTRLYRDESYIKELEARVRRFWWEEVQVKMSELQNKFPEHTPHFNH